MSAFQVSPAHLRLLVGAWIALPPSYRPSLDLKGECIVLPDGRVVAGLNGDNCDDWQCAFDLLARQNARSVGRRYNEEVAPVPGKVTARDACTPISGLPAIVRVLKACDCYDYQACETTDYKSTAAARFVAALRSALVHRLPGYSEAAWAINEEPNPENIIRIM